MTVLQQVSPVFDYISQSDTSTVFAYWGDDEQQVIWSSAWWLPLCRYPDWCVFFSTQREMTSQPARQLLVYLKQQLPSKVEWVPLKSTQSLNSYMQHIIIDVFGSSRHWLYLSKHIKKNNNNNKRGMLESDVGESVEKTGYGLLWQQTQWKRLHTTKPNVNTDQEPTGISVL